MDQNAELQSFQITEIIENLEGQVYDDEECGYLVEEPLDYIFEPDHEPSNKPTMHYSFSDLFFNNEEHFQNGIKFSKRIARMVSETDGVLEYENTSRSDITSDIDDNEEFLENYFNDFDYKHYHLNAVIRHISLSKYPGLSNFGFSLAKQSCNDEELFYINKITPDTPADFCLRLGDIIIELDENNPSEKFKSFNDIQDYLNKKDNLELLVIHESKYIQMKSKNADLIRNSHTNCEDMVIVSWNNQFEAKIH